MQSNTRLSNSEMDYPKSYIHPDISEGELKKLSVNELMCNCKHYRSKIGTECNKSMIQRLEHEILSRNLTDNFVDNWEKI